jgi:hypothetical protein
MEELVGLVMKKTGLPKDTAQSVIKIVLDFLKKKMPPQVGGAIDTFLSGKGEMAGAANLLSGFLDAAQKSGKRKK